MKFLNSFKELSLRTSCSHCTLLLLLFLPQPPTPQEQGEQTTSLTWPTALGDYFATHSATQHPRKPHFVLCFISVTKYKL